MSLARRLAHRVNHDRLASRDFSSDGVPDNFHLISGTWGDLPSEVTLVHDQESSMIVHWDPVLSSTSTTSYRVQASPSPTFASILFDQTVPAVPTIDNAFRARLFTNISYAGDGYTMSEPVDPWFSGYSARFPTTVGQTYFARIYAYNGVWGPPAFALPGGVEAGPVRLTDISRGPIVSTRGDRFVASVVRIGAGRHIAALPVSVVLGNSTFAENRRTYRAYMCSIAIDGIHVSCELQEGVGCCYRLSVTVGTRAALMSPSNVTVSFGPPVVLGFQWESILADPQYSVVVKVRGVRSSRLVRIRASRCAGARDGGLASAYYW